MSIIHTQEGLWKKHPLKELFYNFQTCIWKNTWIQWMLLSQPLCMNNRHGCKQSGYDSVRRKNRYVLSHLREIYQFSWNYIHQNYLSIPAPPMHINTVFQTNPFCNSFLTSIHTSFSASKFWSLHAFCLCRYQWYSDENDKWTQNKDECTPLSSQNIIDICKDKIHAETRIRKRKTKCEWTSKKELTEWVCLKCDIDVHRGCGVGEIILTDVISWKLIYFGQVREDVSICLLTEA